MYDSTENARRARQAELNQECFRLTKELKDVIKVHDALRERYGKVWDSQGLRQDFEVLSFLAPFVVVKERKTGKKGTLEFQHLPRFYFSWQEDR